MSSGGDIFTVRKLSSLMEFLGECYPQSSKTSLKKMVVNGNISVNGHVQKNPSLKVNAGDSVGYRRAEIVGGSNAPFRLIFEDNSILVIDKPAGVLTYGEKGTSGTSAYRELKAYLDRATRSHADLFVVHRLDREVSGLLLFAKTEEAQVKLKDEWREFTKKYEALAEGIIRKKSGVISSYLSEGLGFKVKSGGMREGAKYAETNYSVIKVFGDNTLTELQLVTGRKNQIRVHLADIGHPVVGDRRYGADSTWERRIRLHAVYLKIRHPVTGEQMEFRSSLPRGFLTLKPEHEQYK